VMTILEVTHSSHLEEPSSRETATASLASAVRAMHPSSARGFLTRPTENRAFYFLQGTQDLVPEGGFAVLTPDRWCVERGSAADACGAGCTRLTAAEAVHQGWTVGCDCG